MSPVWNQRYWLEADVAEASAQNRTFRFDADQRGLDHSCIERQACGGFHFVGAEGLHGPVLDRDEVAMGFGGAEGGDILFAAAGAAEAARSEAKDWRVICCIGSARTWFCSGWFR